MVTYDWCYVCVNECKRKPFSNTDDCDEFEDSHMMRGPWGSLVKKYER